MSPLIVFLELFLCVAAAATSPSPTETSVGPTIPPKPVQVSIKKNEFYLRDANFVGGDASQKKPILKDIRFSHNAGFDRMVIDAEWLPAGTQAPVLSRCPYFQVSVDNTKQKITVSIWGAPTLGFDPSRVERAFRSSKLFGKIYFFPKIENDFWIFSVDLKGHFPVEVFELNNPSRIIVDVKNQPRTKT